MNFYRKIQATIGVLFISLVAVGALLFTVTRLFVGIPSQKADVEACRKQIAILHDSPKSENNASAVESLRSDIEYYEGQISKGYISSGIVFIVGIFSAFASVRGYKLVVPLWCKRTRLDH